MSYYGTALGADQYFAEERIDSDDWASFSAENRLKAIKQATRLIDRLNFIGVKTDDEQDLEFPRDDATIIPTDIVIACYEIAFALLTGRDVEYEAEQANDVAAVMGPGRLTVDPDTVNISRVHAIPSIVAWRYLYPYLVPGDNVTLSRVD